ncbi:MAG: NAD(P)/FAD-dependent oxidoreductase, partial [Halorubrum sp.]
MTDPFVVVGADAAGLSAASKFRREAPDREVVVFEKGRWISYAYCGMPYFVAGYVDRMSDLLSLSPSDVDERGIDLRRGSEVVAVDPDAKRVTVETADGDRFEQAYSDLLVATGARATTGSLDVRGVDGAFTLHDMDAAAAIDAYVAEPDAYDPERADVSAVDRERVERNAAMPAPETAAVVGGGYVGVEIAEALAERGLDVRVFHRSGHLLSPFGETVGKRVEAALEAEGVTVHTDAPVEALVGDDRIEAIEVGDEVEAETIPVDMAVVGVGIRPNTGLLDGTGVDLGPGEAIRVDDRGRTSLPDVYA